MRTCVECQNEIPAQIHRNGQTCSDECRLARDRARNERKRAKRRAVLGPRICQLTGCDNEIPAALDTRTLYCSPEHKDEGGQRMRRTRLAKTRAARDARAEREAAEGTAPDPRKGSRNAQALEPEAVRRGKLKADLGLRLFERERAVVQRWQDARSGPEPAAATTATAQP